MKRNSIFMQIIILISGVMPLTLLGSHYEVVPIVADSPGNAPHTDPNLVNPWGFFFAPNGDFWVADNGSNLSTLYQPNGSIVNFIINVPSAPTGALLNSSANRFHITNGSTTAAAKFLFVTEEGTILGFNSSLDPVNAILAVDRSATGAVYKGVEIGGTGSACCCSRSLLFATDFHNGKIDVFNQEFQGQGFMKDYTIPAGFAPFNIRSINNFLYVTFAKQKAPENRDDEPGLGNGYVDIFTRSGSFYKRLISQGNLNSPWGLAVAPNNFGDFSGALLVGNFGDGKINAYNVHTGQFLGQLTDAIGDPIVIDGLWSLEFSSNGTLYFTSGPNGESNGLVGTIVPVP